MRHCFVWFRFNDERGPYSGGHYPGQPIQNASSTQPTFGQQIQPRNAGLFLAPNVIDDLRFQKMRDLCSRELRFTIHSWLPPTPTCAHESTKIVTLKTQQSAQGYRDR